MAADTLAPCVIILSATIILTMSPCISHGNILATYAILALGNDKHADISLCFLKQIQRDKG